MEVRKFEEIESQANDNVVHNYGLGKANSPASKSLDTSAQSEVFALNALGV